MNTIPILKLGDFLLISIQIDMHDRLALQLQIDISSLEMVDSFMSRMLGNIASMTRMLGAETVVVGIRPAVAITIVELGLTLPNVRTALNVETGMEMLRQLVETSDQENDHERHQE